MEEKDILEYINKIINKKFSTKQKGYNPDEVDETLDDIFEKFSKYIEKYEDLKVAYDNLLNKKNELEEKNKKLISDNALLNSQLEQLQTSGISFQLFNERMNRLEKKQNINEQEINELKKNEK